MCFKALSPTQQPLALHLLMAQSFWTCYCHRLIQDCYGCWTFSLRCLLCRELGILNPGCSSCVLVIPAAPDV